MQLEEWFSLTDENLAISPKEIQSSDLEHVLQLSGPSQAGGFSLPCIATLSKSVGSVAHCTVLGLISIGPYNELMKVMIEGQNEHIRTI